MRIAWGPHRTGQSDPAGRLDPFSRVTAGQPQHRQGRVESLLVDGNRLENAIDDNQCRWTDPLGPLAGSRFVPQLVLLADRQVGLIRPILIRCRYR